MQIAKDESQLVTEGVSEVKEPNICELNDLQLALVGGGSGMVVVG